ncbi:MAG: flagellar basal body P-ring formation chaperone FlgA [Gallionellaceae bacterium]|nr:flagellar basal body P-ring formation chaperone FlgA [Gallionellaceae bacterium]
MRNLLAALFLIMTCAQPSWAAAPQSHERIRETALAYAQSQTRSLPGKVTIRIGKIDSRTALRACAPLEAFLPAGASLIGRTTIGVRCNTDPAWSIFVQADVRVSATLLVANRPLAQNTVLGAGDFTLQDGELGQPGILTDPAQAIGKTLRFAIGAGQVLRQDMLRAPFVVTQGRVTEVKVNGDGYSVRSSGQALNNGAEGQPVQVRMPSGRVVSGAASTDGSVEVRP